MFRGNPPSDPPDTPLPPAPPNAAPAPARAPGAPPTPPPDARPSNPTPYSQLTAPATVLVTTGGQRETPLARAWSSALATLAEPELTQLRTFLSRHSEDRTLHGAARAQLVNLLSAMPPPATTAATTNASASTITIPQPASTHARIAAWPATVDAPPTTLSDVDTAERARELDEELSDLRRMPRRPPRQYAGRGARRGGSYEDAEAAIAERVAAAATATTTPRPAQGRIFVTVDRRQQQESDDRAYNAFIDADTARLRAQWQAYQTTPGRFMAHRGVPLPLDELAGAGQGSTSALLEELLRGAAGRVDDAFGAARRAAAATAAGGENGRDVLDHLYGGTAGVDEAFRVANVGFAPPGASGARGAELQREHGERDERILEQLRVQRERVQRDRDMREWHASERRARERVVRERQAARIPRSAGPPTREWPDARNMTREELREYNRRVIEEDREENERYNREAAERRRREEEEGGS